MDKQDNRVEGVIVFDTTAKKFRFIDYIMPAWFDDPAFDDITKNLVLICKHVISVPDTDVDIVAAQLKVLDKQEADLTAKYHAAKTEIEARRQSLLAIECDGSAQ